MATVWTTISSTEFIAEGFNPDERTTVQTAAGGDDGLDEILSKAIDEWRGVIDAAGYPLDTTVTNSIPPSCRRHIVAQVRWQLLIKFPALKQLQTDERKLAAQDAEKKLIRIEEGKAPIEEALTDSTDVPPGDWNSNVKLAMRLDTTRAND